MDDAKIAVIGSPLRPGATFDDEIGRTLVDVQLDSQRSRRPADCYLVLLRECRNQIG
jgi:hypothetical protein